MSAPLGTGHITKDGTGTAEFPIRGARELRWTVVTPKQDARLRVGRDECAMAWVYPDSDDMAVAGFWHGRVRIEGYEMEIRGTRDGDVLRVEFLDCVQPLPVTA